MIENHNKAGLPYRALKGYLRTYHDNIFYRHVHYLGLENIPAAGVPAIIASNHQNNMNDALGIVFADNKHKLYLFTRADIFGRSKLSDKFFKGIGLIPAYRLNFDGEESLAKNHETFGKAGELLNDGEKIVIFPEACHQDRHWLGSFSLAYLRLAFEAAEKSGFEKDIQVVPSCNHYSTYFGTRNDLLIRFGKPISLKPYYELYKTKPRTAQRGVNRIVHGRIQEMMLDIRDAENYDAITYILDSYGYRWAEAHGYDARKLPEKLEADKHLSAAIEQLAGQYPEEMQDIFNRFEDLNKAMSASDLDERSFRDNPKPAGIFLRCLALLLLSPVAIAGIWPGFPMYAIPKKMVKNLKDKMFEDTLKFGLNAVVILPIVSILSLIVAGLLTNWWVAVAWVMLFPWLFAFECDYCKGAKRVIKDIRLCRNRHTESVTDIELKRQNLFNDLDHILSRKQTENTILNK